IRSSCRKFAMKRGIQTIPSGTITQVAPQSAILNMSNVERSKLSGEGQAMRSAATMANSRADQHTNAATARCEITTPLGTPVEPEVKSRKAVPAAHGGA